MTGFVQSCLMQTGGNVCADRIKCTSGLSLNFKSAYIGVKNYKTSTMMKNAKYISIGAFVLLFLFSACSSEEEEEFCDETDFLGTWRVEQNICSIHSSNTVDIVEGTGSSRIILNLDSDTIPLLVVNCVATHKSSDFLVEKEVTAVLKDDEIELEYRSQVAILPIFCTLKLTK